VALSEYDMRILALISSGHNAEAMARLLQVSPRTVENHRRRLHMKLDVHNSGHAVARAISMGLIDSPDQNGQARHQERRYRPLVMVSGQPGSSLDAVRCALLAAQISFVHIATPAPVHQEHWIRWQRGPIVAVLIDPTYDDWLVSVGVTTQIVVVLSIDADLPTFVDVLLRGAHALLRGDDVAEDLAAILPAVAHGYLVVDATHGDDIAGLVAIRMGDGSPAVPALTAREGDILGSIAAGHSIRQTARMLGIAAKTVENTQARLYRKLGARNRAEALTIAHRLGLLDARPEPA
jgi:DNA-binding CsgD family transcriptional regulator